MSRIEHPKIEIVTIETVDRAIYNWFDKTVDAHVKYVNGERKKVNIKISTGERFVSSRQNSDIRDDKGMLILPIMSVRRTSIVPTPDMQALGTDTSNFKFSKRIDKKTRTLMNANNSRLSSQKLVDPIVYEVYTVPYPDRMTVSYDIIAYAQYISQMNEIIEKVFHQLDIRNSFVAPLNNHHRHPPLGEQFEERKKIEDGYIVGFFDNNLSDSSNFEEFTEQERIIKWSTSITVPVTLQLDTEGEKPAIQVERTAFGLSFGDEAVTFVDDMEEMTRIFGKY
jgi:hypothetical protein